MLDKKWQLRVQSIERDRLNKVKSFINIDEQTPSFFKRGRIIRMGSRSNIFNFYIEERFRAIDQENKKFIQKLRGIIKRPSETGI